MASIFWKTGASGDWSDPANWSTGMVPTAADTVTIDAPGTYAITEDQASAAVAGLDLDAAGATILDKGTLTLGGTLPEFALSTSFTAGGTLALHAGAPAPTISCCRTSAPAPWSTGG